MRSSVHKCAASAFQGCKSLETIEIPAGVTGIGERALSGCDSLASVTIPASVETMGTAVFEDCPKLTSAGPASDTETTYSITYNWEETIPSTAFNGANYLDPEEVVIPEEITVDKETLFEGTNTGVPSGNNVPDTGYTIRGTVRSYGDGETTLELLLDGETVQTVTVTEKVGEYVFTGLDKGIYTLRITKPNHVARTYTVKVGVV